MDSRWARSCAKDVEYEQVVTVRTVRKTTRCMLAITLNTIYDLLDVQIIKKKWEKKIKNNK